MTIPAFDIFLIDSDENLRWLEAVPARAEAERRARELATPTYPRCLIFDQQTGQKHIVVGQQDLYFSHQPQEVSPKRVP